MIARWRAAPAAPEVHALGEGPLWDGPRDRVLWVDILAGTVHEGRLDDDRVFTERVHHLDRTVGAVVAGRTGELLVAGTENLLVVDPGGAVTPGPAVLPAGSGRRLNDGACDPSGTFLVGSLAFDDRPGGEVLVRVTADGAVHTVDAGLSLSNGMGWSPDGALFYSIDSVPGVVYVRDWPDGPRRVLLTPDVTPDGMCVDARGDLWIAFWDGGEVRRYSPAGELTGVVEVGVPHVTSVAFVGPGLDRLLITTATKDLTDADLARHPDSGRLFLADVGATGQPATPWAGFR
ncbi:SMP-30/gluconolactonase/LRE family protein [Jidongwangia harbinensis]|uniref:SMP-30/gluconolactonase/LRE family protein n=1 Tax=Jidongwangia harbinensis TaxID=2878561 RepID=UPI001CDA0259|nr:SMP-30/gluconolactonase/LRE family protein [Jidongwangia harbinensis]MCA2214293.1 SMP-30/gluconolactonase/LRE family protein [Jidongwangia harbinensis]